MKVKKALLLAMLSLLFAVVLNAQSSGSAQSVSFTNGIKVFIKSYPDISFNYAWDAQYKDYKITCNSKELGSKEFFWSNGSLLPEEELVNKDKYTSLLYPYSKTLADPADFTEEQKEALKNYGSKESRRSGVGTPMFFFDYLYSSTSQKEVEKYIQSVMFLGKATRVHTRILPALKRVESKVYDLAKTDKEAADFVNKIKSADAYYWRLIDGTNRKSFHSLGIAVDIMPVRITGEIYWSWARDKNPSGWMLTPLSKRWLVPESVVSIFEEEGFIWGGKWAIWDNMHFEYHPELINYNFYK